MRQSRRLDGLGHIIGTLLVVEAKVGFGTPSLAGAELEHLLWRLTTIVSVKT